VIDIKRSCTEECYGPVAEDPEIQIENGTFINIPDDFIRMVRSTKISPEAEECGHVAESDNGQQEPQPY
jgi:hypothetical protein